jgi:exosome complex exonuclease RRP6
MDKSRNYRAKWTPAIKEKLFALQPYDPANLGVENIYMKEIMHWLKSEKESVKARTTVRPVSPCHAVEETELVYIETKEGLEQMISEIEAAGEVAIDLEHHDFRSYRGITCLIQLSTRFKDYIVDPFPIFNEITALNRVTCNPNIRKVFHAADCDIVWLQRDFSVYVVNMFDTAQAAQVAEIEGGHGLANLVKFFCGVNTNKDYQMADWRKRPLSQGMIQYARIDTHFLLYIRDKLEERVLTKGSPGMATVWGRNMLIGIYEKSAGVSMKSYQDSPTDYEPAAFKKFLSKLPAAKIGDAKSDPNVRACLLAILTWRDDMAKKLDESRNYVLANAACLKLANAMPNNVNTVLRLLGNPGSGPFAGMKILPNHAQGILKYIYEGRGPLHHT